MSELRDIFKDYAMKHNLLRLCDRLLVAVSGGPDSVSLLHLLCEFKNEWDLHLEVAHLQHGIRGDAAQQDAMFVERLAEELKLPFHMREVDLPRLRRSEEHTSELQSRRDLVCRLLLEKKKKTKNKNIRTQKYTR